MNSKKWLITIVAILAAAAIGVGAYAYISSQNNDSGSNDQSSLDDSGDDQKPTEVTKQLTLYYIATEDAGVSGDLIGCDDSAVSIRTVDVTTSDVVKSSLEMLLADKNQFYGGSGLYNALYQSDLRYDNSSLDGDHLTINLSGDLVLGGECDNPRVKAQLEKTAESATEVGQVSIMINGKTLNEALSLK
jgi:hypothetical protein